MVDLFSNEDLDAILNSDDNVWQDLGFELLNDDDPYLSTQTEPITSSIQKGDKFFSLKLFKHALLDQAIQERWEPRCVKSNVTHV